MVSFFFYVIVVPNDLHANYMSSVGLCFEAVEIGSVSKHDNIFFGMCKI